MNTAQSKMVNQLKVYFMHKIISSEKELLDSFLDSFEVPSIQIPHLVRVLNIMRDEWVKHISYSTNTSFRIQTNEIPNVQDIQIIRQFVEYIVNSPIIIKHGNDFIEISTI